MSNCVNIMDMSKYIGLNLLEKGMTITPLKLQKLLYYCQAWTLVFCDKKSTLFDDVPQAWVNGPVYPVVFDYFKDQYQIYDNMPKAAFCKEDEISIKTDVLIAQLADKMQLSPEQISLFNSIMELYGSMTSDKLVLLTHAEKPWLEQRSGLQPFDQSNRQISLETMYQYYRDRYQKNHANQR